MFSLRTLSLRDYFFAAIFLLLIGGTYISYQRIKQLVEAGDLVNQSTTIKQKLQELNGNITASEALQRGYLLLQNENYLIRYRATLSKNFTVIEEIRGLTKGNPRQQQSIDTVKSLLSERVLILSRVLDNFVKDGFLDKAMVNEGQAKMDVLSSTINKMISEENNRLTLRTAEKIRYESVSPLLTLFFSILIIAIVMFAFRKIRNDSKRLSKFNRSLEKNNLELETTKNFVQRLLDSSVDLIASFDTNLVYTTMNQRSLDMLGRAPEDFIGKSILELYPQIRDTDAHATMLKALKGETVHLEFVRGAARPDRFYDVFYIPLFENKRVSGMLSIARDITPLVDANASLKLKNTELEKTNAELASFNYVASHDLQEPLRKIQIFTDRILEESANELSEQTKKHFDRITAAALRMRKLIGALLNYSLANRGDVVLEETDLNLLVEEAREQVAFEDPAKQLIVETTDLPKMKVITVQLLQLFVNLFGNSVKYKKPDTDTVVKITATKMSGREVDDERARHDARYLQISISDNGIGFDPAYANKIFELFQRLHTKSQYSGTGIGLAICRKIAENHGGFITATGEPNVGATFRLYLPL